MSNVIQFPRGELETPEDVFERAKSIDTKRVVVIGIDGEGEMYVMTTRMPLVEAMGFAAIAQQAIFNMNTEE